MAEVIRVDYEALTKIASRFQNESKEIEQVLQMIKSSMTPLQNGGWVGRGSDSFFNEMESEIIPAVQRLADALEQAGGISRQIGNVMQSAEEEAGSPFHASETGGNMHVPRDWLNSISSPSLTGVISNQNDFGIPFNWLAGVAGVMGAGNGSNNWGIPENWLEGVTDSLGGSGGTASTPSGGSAAGAEGVGGGAAGGSGGSSGSPTDSPSTPTGGSGGGKSETPTDINSPYGQQTARTGPQTLFGGGKATVEAAKGRLSYQSLSTLASAPAASTPSPVASESTGGSAAPAPSGSGGNSAGIGLAVAALTPLLGIMGKSVKDLLSDD